MRKEMKQRTTAAFSKQLYASLVASAKRRGVSVNDVICDAADHWIEAEMLAEESEVAKQVQAIWQKVRQGFANPYQDLIAHWRTERTWRQIEELATRRLKLDAFPANAYLIRAIGEIIQQLGPHDFFGAVTNIRYWRDVDDAGILADRYLQLQRDAVVRGMRLHRIFLLVKDDELPDRLRLNEEIKRQIAFQKSLESFGEQVKTSYLDLRPIDRDKALMEYGHFAILMRSVERDRSLPSVSHDESGACAIIRPAYAGDQITDLNFFFSDGPCRLNPETDDYFSRFDIFASRSEPIEKLARELES
jgi:hypothetical protein